MQSHEGRVCVLTVLCTIGVVAACCALLAPTPAEAAAQRWGRRDLMGAAIFVNMALAMGWVGLVARGDHGVAVRAANVTLVGCLGCLNLDHSFGWYLVAMAAFHLSEYVFTAWTNPRNLTLSSFLLDHSLAYWAALLASVAEFWLEVFLLRGLKTFACALTFPFGLGLVIGGEIVRKLAMVTAGENFSHVIEVQQRPEHRLVTRGVYSLVRHPSYTGWFLWSIGTQVLLANPACCVAYTCVAWSFFAERIREEEVVLLTFFDEEYIRYMRRVPDTGIPFVRGTALARHTFLSPKREMKIEHLHYTGQPSGSASASMASGDRSTATSA